jgi:GNAT superfamily N-acetyltransferase
VEIRDLAVENLDDHPCLRYLRVTEEAARMTKNWLRKVYQRFGSCVKVAYVEGKPVGMVQYAPRDLFPHVDQPEVHWTILIHCIYLPDKKHNGRGVGRSLIEALIRDLQKPHPYLNGGRFKRIEAIAGRGRPGPAGPLGFFMKLGFKPIKDLGEYDVLVRLDLQKPRTQASAETNME